MNKEQDAPAAMDDAEREQARAYELDAIADSEPTTDTHHRGA